MRGVVTALLLTTSAVAGLDTAFLDHVQLGDSHQETAHALSWNGNVRAETLDTEMGSFRERWSVRTLQGKNTSLTLELRAPRPGKSLLLEVQEIHHRRPDAFGYLVLVNDRDVYFRTYQEYGAGPSHFFVVVEPGLLGDAKRVRVTFRAAGSGTFSLGRIWAYDDFFESVAKPEGVVKKMGLFLPPGAIHLEGDTGKKKANDEASQLARYMEQKKRYAGLQDYEPIGTLAGGGSYGGREPGEGRKSLLQGYRLSAQSGMPGQMMLNGLGWFAGPTGPDGLGGFFSDLRYNKSSYNEAKRTYRASWPNEWGNTPAYTLRDPNLNAFLEKRFQQMMDGNQEELAWLRLQGTPAAPILIREFAPASGEITDAVIAAAARDGLQLDPADGMSFEERLWMHRDAVRTWQEYADSLKRAVGRDYVIVDNGTVQLPQEQLFDNLYGHPNFMTDAPMGDPRWGGGQHGMVDGLWSSGEIGATSGHRGSGANVKFRDLAMYDYLPARGKFASINLERTMLKEDFNVLKLYYERGAQFVTLYNADDGDEKFVRQVDGIAQEPASAPPHSQPVVTMTRLAGPTRAAGPRTAFHREQLYRLETAGDPFAVGLTLDLDGRISPGDANRIEVFLGDTPDNLHRVAVLQEKDLPDPDHWTPRMTSQKLLDLGESMVGKTQTYLKLVFEAEGAEDAAFLLAVNARTRWPRESGHTGAVTLTRAQARTLQLWLQERSVCARLLQAYRGVGAEDAVYAAAQDLFSRGWYRRAHRLLSAEISQVLPARYAVRGQGRLGRWPVEVQLEGREEHAFITLESLSEDAAVITLRAGREGQACALSVAGIGTARCEQSGRYTLRKSGAVEFAETATVQRPLPAQLLARFLGGNKGRIQVDVQDLELMNYASSISLPVRRDATWKRSAARLENAELAKNDFPQRHDEVLLTLNPAGEVTSVTSRYGFDRGIIKRFHPPVVVGGASNGAIELENGNRYQLVFEKGGVKFDTVALQGSVVGYEVQMLADAIKAGHAVEVTFSPYADKGGLPRIVQLKQPRRVLLDVDYTKDTDGAWRQAAYAVQGVDVRLHKPEPNYLYRVELPLLRPTAAFTPGSVTYKITGEKTLGTTAVEFAARAFEKSSRVTFSTSPDGETWTRAGQFDNTWQNCISQSLNALPYQFIDLTAAVAGRKQFYLNVELAVNSADHRFCLAKLRVATEEQP